MLGDAVFKKSLHEYMDRWHGKHPIPWDFFNSMNTGSGKNLNWFWNNWFFSNNYIDLKITKTESKDGKLLVSITNAGGFAVPFDAIATLADGTTQKTHFTPAVWEKGDKSITVSVAAAKKITSVQLDGGIFMDFTPADNTMAVGN